MASEYPKVCDVLMFICILPKGWRARTRR